MIVQELQFVFVLDVPAGSPLALPGSTQSFVSSSITKNPFDEILMTCSPTAKILPLHLRAFLSSPPPPSQPTAGTQSSCDPSSY